MRLLALLLLIGGCRFDPTVGGESLVGCQSDSDCPRDAECVDGACIPVSLHVVELTATPDTVRPGEACSFEVTAMHSGSPDALRYVWVQRQGPAVELRGNGTRATELTTAADYVGAYQVEVRVDSPFDPAVTASAHCVALDDEDAAFIVQGQTGDCSRSSPCNDFGDAPNAARYYLGVSSDNEVVAFDPPWSVLHGKEVHGGFVYPGWARLEWVETALAPFGEGVGISCNDCVVSGIVQWGSATDAPSPSVSIVGDRVTFRDSRVVIGGSDFSIYGVSIYDANDVLVEGLDIRVRPDAELVEGDVYGLRIYDSFRVVARDLDIDLTGVMAESKYGVRLGNTGPNQVGDARIERVRVRTGAATGSVRGLAVSCGDWDVWSSTFDASEGQSNATTALLISGYSSECLARLDSRASVYLGGGDGWSRAVTLYSHFEGRLLNCIFDAGDGYVRRVFGWNQSGRYPLEMPGSMMVIDGGLQPLDGWAEDFYNNLVPLEEMSEELVCTECPIASESAGWVGRSRGDFHLAEDSRCRGAGSPLPDGPTLDLDRRAWAAPPSIGAYEY